MRRPLLPASSYVRTITMPRFCAYSRITSLWFSVEYCWCSVDMRTYSAACAGLGLSRGGLTDGEFGLSIVGTSGNVFGARRGNADLAFHTGRDAGGKRGGSMLARRSLVPLRPFQTMFCCTPFLRPMPKGCSFHPGRAPFSQPGLHRPGGYTRISGAVMFAPSRPVVLHVVRVIPPPLFPAVPTGLFVF